MADSHYLPKKSLIEPAITEVLAFLESMVQRAKDAGTMIHGNVPVDVPSLHSALAAAKRLAPPAKTTDSFYLPKAKKPHDSFYLPGHRTIPQTNKVLPRKGNR